MKKLSKEEMKNVMGGGDIDWEEDADGFFLVSCTFEPGYHGSYGTCSGSKEDCQQAANTWCEEPSSHCKSCKI